MGRYAAPRFDHHDNEDGCQAMDWTVIPDEDEDAGEIHANGSRDVGRTAVGDSRSLVCRDPPGANGRRRRDAGDVGDPARRDRLARGSGEFARRGDRLRHRAMGATTDDDRCEFFLRAVGEHLELSNRYLEEQHLSQKKRQRTRAIAIVAVAIVAIVLKRHAPPPPPLWNQSPLVAASFPTNSDSTKLLAPNLPIDDTMAGVTQHETWASYSRHFLRLVQRASAYGASVAWYAISNAFRYAMEEVRDVSIAFIRGNGSDDNESMWTNWKRKMSSVGAALSQLKTAKESPPKSHATTDIQRHDDGTHDTIISPCPIRLPAANNLHTHLPRGATTRDVSGEDQRIVEGWSTEEFLRQTIGASLSPQNLALKVIAEGIDAWGEALVRESPVSLVHNMATAVSARPRDRYVDDETLAGWILPPSKGFLLVGPEGVGKLHAARRVAHLFLGHCSESSGVSIGTQEREGVVEVIAGEYNNDGREVHPAKKLIVDHIRIRKGLGAVIIIHHIELLPSSLLSDISRVLSGKTDTLSYETLDEEPVDASCNGTVFVLTSKQWGTKSIFQQIQRNEGLAGLRRESLVSSVRREVDSHLDYWTKLAAHMTIVSFFPFEIEDLSSILQNRVQTLNRKYQGVHWRRLEVSHATVKHAVGIDHVEYLDLYARDDGSDDEESDASLLTFSASGARALDDNALWQTLKTRLVTGTRRRPGLDLKIDLDEDSGETVFRWCDREIGGAESCEEEWRSLLS